MLAMVSKRSTEWPTFGSSYRSPTFDRSEAILSDGLIEESRFNELESERETYSVEELLLSPNQFETQNLFMVAKPD